MHIYLLDEKEKTLPISEVTGSAILQIPGKKPKKITLTPSKDHLSATVDLEEVQKFAALVSLKVDGKTRIGRFSYQKPEEHHKEGDHKDEGHH